MKTLYIIFGLCGVSLISVAEAQSTDKARNSSIVNIVKNGAGDWSDYRSGDAPGDVSAASMLGMSGSAVSTIGTVKDFTAAILSSAQGSTGMALSWTPARSNISPMTLATYLQPVYDQGDPKKIKSYDDGASARLIRMLNAATVGFARNNTTINSITYRQQAISLSTTGYWKVDDDPVVAIDKVLRGVGSECSDEMQRALKGGLPDVKVGDAGTAKVSQDAEKEMSAAWGTCNSEVAKSRRWNPSTYSLSYSTGWIQPTSIGGNSLSLGQASVASVSLGFGNSKSNADTGYLATLAYKWNKNEPILSSLGGSSVNRQNSNLIYGRISGGNNSARLVAEASNVKSSSTVTASQLVFKGALGVDYLIYKDVWLSFRYGRQVDINGVTSKNAGMLNISFSPSSTLN